MNRDGAADAHRGPAAGDQAAGFAYPEQPINPIPTALHRGLDRLGQPALRDRALRYVIEHFGVRCTHFAPGEVTFVFDSSPIRINLTGAVHGGVIADDAFGAGFVAVARPRVLSATASLTIDYLRPAFLGSPGIDVVRVRAGLWS